MWKKPARESKQMRKYLKDEYSYQYPQQYSILFFDSRHLFFDYSQLLIDVISLDFTCVVNFLIHWRLLFLRLKLHTGRHSTCHFFPLHFILSIFLLFPLFLQQLFHIVRPMLHINP